MTEVTFQLSCSACGAPTGLALQPNCNAKIFRAMKSPVSARGEQAERVTACRVTLHRQTSGVNAIAALRHMSQ